MCVYSWTDIVVCVLQKCQRWPHRQSASKDIQRCRRHWQGPLQVLQTSNHPIPAAGATRCGTGQCQVGTLIVAGCPLYTFTKHHVCPLSVSDACVAVSMADRTPLLLQQVSSSSSSGHRHHWSRQCTHRLTTGTVRHRLIHTRRSMWSDRALHQSCSRWQHCLMVHALCATITPLSEVVAISMFSLQIVHVSG